MNAVNYKMCTFSKYTLTHSLQSIYLAFSFLLSPYLYNCVFVNTGIPWNLNIKSLSPSYAPKNSYLLKPHAFHEYTAYYEAECPSPCSCPKLTLRPHPCHYA